MKCSGLSFSLSGVENKVMQYRASGGVSGNSLLRERCREFDAAFAEPRFSSDNAFGIALLTWMQEEP